MYRLHLYCGCGAGAVYKDTTMKLRRSDVPTPLLFDVIWRTTQNFDVTWKFLKMYYLKSIAQVAFIQLSDIKK
ncbi:unnamed protein product [Clavelina lepadiformis]|uniref:Uncharacterized protein n=1 Tax=Clavelina lepadiformis TaxID=159417 RepID=A0ABP0F767_CLALP